MNRQFPGMFRYWGSLMLSLVLIGLVAMGPTAPLKGQSNERESSQDDRFRLPVSPDEASEGWIALWDGHTAFGWRNTRHTRLQGGQWHLPQEPSLVRTAVEFVDGQIVLEYSLPAESEASLLVRTNPRARENGKDHWAIALPTTQGEKQEIQVTLDGSSVGLKTSNESSEPSSSTVSGLPTRGYVGFIVQQGTLTVHRMLFLPAGSTYSLSEPARWEQRHLEDTKLTELENGFQLQGGPGYLSLKQWQPQNFLFQFQAALSEPTNSGVFFRCIPGEKMNGYEAQLNNQMIDGDPTNPADCGTGGIFRRQNARRIIASPEQWFTETIVANGGNIAVWVNGYQVTDWSDQRAPHPNPRKGRRLEAGEIQLQAHDPETNARFRRLQLTLYPKVRLGEKP